MLIMELLKLQEVLILIKEDRSGILFDICAKRAVKKELSQREKWNSKNYRKIKVYSIHSESQEGIPYTECLAYPDETLTPEEKIDALINADKLYNLLNKTDISSKILSGINQTKNTKKIKPFASLPKKKYPFSRIKIPRCFSATNLISINKSVY